MLNTSLPVSCPRHPPGVPLAICALGASSSVSTLLRWTPPTLLGLFLPPPVRLQRLQLLITSLIPQRALDSTPPHLYASLQLNASAICVKVVACTAVAWNIGTLTVTRIHVPQSTILMPLHLHHLPTILVQDTLGSFHTHLVAQQLPTITTMGIKSLVALRLLSALHLMRPPLCLPLCPREMCL